MPIDRLEHRFGPWRVRSAPWAGLGLLITGLDHDAGAPAPVDYVNDVLFSEAHRDAFFALIDRAGLVVCRDARADVDPTYADVRGRSSRGRLSQGEYYHHDGCSGPVKPRVVEIRCPHQAVARHTHTAIAPFPDTLYAMLLELPVALRAGAVLAAHHDAVAAGAPLPSETWDQVQGLVIRAVRRALSAEDARAYLRAVDVRAGAYREPWPMGESRYIANANPGRTMQHRRAYLEQPGERANGKLVKRWPGHVEAPPRGDDDETSCGLGSITARGDADPRHDGAR